MNKVSIIAHTSMMLGTMPIPILSTTVLSDRSTFIVCVIERIQLFSRLFTHIVLRVTSNPTEHSLMSVEIILMYFRFGHSHNVTHLIS